MKLGHLCVLCVCLVLCDQRQQRKCGIPYGQEGGNPETPRMHCAFLALKADPSLLL